MDQQHAPFVDWRTIRTDVDQTAAWMAEHHPWQRLELSRLHTRREFEPGAGWGRNAWNEYYKGDTRLRSYAAAPESLLETHNLEVVYQTRVMRILCRARPDFTKPRPGRPELLCYFRWMGQDE